MEYLIAASIAYLVVASYFVIDTLYKSIRQDRKVRAFVGVMREREQAIWQQELDRAQRERRGPDLRMMPLDWKSL